MNRRQEYRWTTNRKVYNILRKRWLSHVGEISCDICRYNRGENQPEWQRKSWKRYRKKQWDRSDIHG